MRRILISLVALFSFVLVAGCSSNVESTTPAPPAAEETIETPKVPKPVEVVQPETDPEPAADEPIIQRDDDGKIMLPRINGSTDLPARADQTDEEREYLEEWYTASLHETSDMGSLKDKKLVKAAHEVCDWLDRDPENTKLAAFNIGVTYTVDADAQEGAHYVIGAAAVRSVCPEHHDVVWE